jgi:serine/threonine protein kinase
MTDSDPTVPPAREDPVPPQGEIEIPQRVFAVLADAVAGSGGNYQQVATALALDRTELAHAVFRLIRSPERPTRVRLLLKQLGLGAKEIVNAAAQTEDRDLVKLLFEIEPDLFAPYREWAEWRVWAQATVSGLAVTNIGKPLSPPGPVALQTRIVGRRYTIEAMLGEGGQAPVYRATDMALQRPVAIKLLPPPPEETVQTVFLREAELQRSLVHPGILPLYDWGYEGHQGFLVFPLCPGSTAWQRKEVAIRPRAAADLVGKVALALDYLHSHGIIHCDVKPHNILLDTAGQPRLIDFGLARRDHERELPRWAGTPAYMSPEQLCAQPLDGRSDVYSLGVTLYELLAGRLPFHPGLLNREGIEELRRQVIHDVPVPPSAHNRSSPAQLDEICMRALAKRPEDRYQTAGAMAEEIRHWQRTGVARFLDWLRDLFRRRSKATPADSIGQGAIDWNARSLAASVAAGDRQGEGTALVNLAIAYSMAGNLSAASSRFEQALTIYRELGDTVAQADTLWHFSRTLHEMGDTRQATLHAQQALQLYAELGNPMEAAVRSELAAWEAGR